ncbi:hypothetical protein CH373_11280 [Leptospira perolatii]|uniref:Signal transduction histidine kinase internal region domain-containing protein n=1 Tax=Leptospira perolatii TaxID=2023191 RepID=A0A2M9ZLV8_9LEPT|nr:histidine kinase [Leptospira perolatii]PJZ69715.1 hypothetical protein CH360_08955 [Leptospira perolatii]PJZ73070.1 hypothetical protein CH373_11280 [Leptospira perolatii]
MTDRMQKENIGKLGSSVPGVIVIKGRFFAIPSFILVFVLGTLGVIRGDINIYLWMFVLFLLGFVLIYLGPNRKASFQNSIFASFRSRRKKESYLSNQSDGYQLRMAPHFLFNCLMTLRILIDQGNSEAATSYLDSLGGSLRFLFRYSALKFVTLKEEIDFTLNYIELLKSKYRGGISIRISNLSSISYDEWEVPPFSVQTLVENSIKHNTFLEHADLKIEISLEQVANGKIKIAVRDNGKGSVLTPDLSGTLGNLFDKIKGNNPEANISIASGNGRGFEVSFEVVSKSK